MLLLKHLVLNPRFLLCFGIAWIITNGWSYVLLGIGFLFDITWMTTVAGAYVTFLWLPFTPEKIITFGIAMLLRRLLFPHDKKTEAAINALKKDDSGEAEKTDKAVENKNDGNKNDRSKDAGNKMDKEAS